MMDPRVLVRGLVYVSVPKGRSGAGEEKGEDEGASDAA